MIRSASAPVGIHRADKGRTRMNVMRLSAPQGAKGSGEPHLRDEISNAYSGTAASSLVRSRSGFASPSGVRGCSLPVWKTASN